MTGAFAGAQIRFIYSAEEETMRVELDEPPREDAPFATAFMFWFAWNSVYPEAPVYQPPERGQQPE